MNKDLHLELETQGNLLETMRAEIEILKGGKLLLGEDKNLMMSIYHKGGEDINYLLTMS
jgi:hypothetical protein